MVDPTFNNDSFSRSQIVRLTGLPDDVLAHWTKEGLIRPKAVRPGTGRHKAFGRRQVMKAAILAELRRFGCSIQSIRWFAKLMDDAFDIQDTHSATSSDQLFSSLLIAQQLNSLENGQEVTVFDAKIKGRRLARGVEDLIGQLMFGESEDSTERVKSIALTYYESHYDRLCLMAASDLTEEHLFDARYRQIWLTWPAQGGWEIYSDSDENFSGMKNFPRAAILLHISQIQRELWGVIPSFPERLPR